MNPIFNTFHHETFGDLHTAIDNGEILFLVDDVCKVLDYPKVSNALCFLDDDEFRTVDGNTFINETGVYTLIFRSPTPFPRMYKRWIRDEVIPELRIKIAGEKFTFVKQLCDNTSAILELVKKIKSDTDTLKTVKLSFDDEVILPF